MRFVRDQTSFAQLHLLHPPLLVRLKYVVALVLAQSTVFVSLKNIKMVSVGGLGRPIHGWLAAAGGVEVVSCHMTYEATTCIYRMTTFEPISTPQVDSRQCGHLLCQENHPNIADSLPVIFP